MEARQLLTSASPLSDEFSDPATLSDWNRINETEGWNADQLAQWDIGQTRSDQMTLIPETVTWFQDYRGPFVYKEFSGDFAVTTRVEVTDRDDVSGSDGDDIPGDGQFSLAGLMIRTPRAISSPADWNPGSMLNDGTNNGENYVFLSLGYGSGGNEFSFEVKTTRNSNSQLELTPLGPNADTALLQIARVGDSVIALYQLPGQDWQVHRRYTRTDMPDTLQVGMVTYTDWQKASTLQPFAQNSTVITPDNDPSPGTAFNPDLNAGFDYTRFAELTVPAELQGVDLVNSATDQQLLSFLGAPANLEFVPTSEQIEVSSTVRDINGIQGIEVGEIFEVDVDFHDATNDQAAFAGYADIEFDETRFEVLEVVYDPDYVNGRTGTINNITGQIDEVGATAGSDIPAASTVFTLRVRALQAGTSSFTLNAGEHPVSEILAFTSSADRRSTATFDGSTVSVGSADLQSVSFDALSDHVLLGQTDVTFAVQNSGSVAAGGFETHVVWSPNNIPGDADDVIVAGSAVAFAGLAAGASEARTVSLQLDRAALLAHSLEADPAGGAVGTLSADVSHLFLVVDTTDVVDESNEANNSGTGLGTDGDDVTYFPFDGDGSGVVTPSDALYSLQRINSNDAFSDSDGNGSVTPLETLMRLQRLGYVRHASGSPEANAVGMTATSEATAQPAFAAASNQRRSLFNREPEQGSAATESMAPTAPTAPSEEGFALQSAFEEDTNWLDVI